MAKVGIASVVGWAALAALAWGAGAHAQDAGRDFCADRPGKGSPPCVLDAGRFQAELGVADGAWSRGGGVSTDDTAFGALELRLGLTPTLEGQLSWTAHERIRQKDRASGAVSTVDGVGDLGLALRWSLRNPGGDGASVALQPFVTAPTGAEGIGGDAWQGGVIVPISLPLNADWSLALSPELDARADADGSGRHAGFGGAVGIGRSFGPVALGAELWADREQDPSGHVTSASFDLTAGWTPASAKDLQLDASAYVGLNRDTPDLEVAVGVAKRF
ncbi:transporter [Caulobacter sp. LjRoot300]|uniref:transporter n=1 Tax=Caulobacter sp. LjRoot300 TaxID=3342321 RepID=UPI003ECD46B2